MTGVANLYLINNDFGLADALIHRGALIARACVAADEQGAPDLEGIPEFDEAMAMELPPCKSHRDAIVALTTTLEAVSRDDLPYQLISDVIDYLAAQLRVAKVA